MADQKSEIGNSMIRVVQAGKEKSVIEFGITHADFGDGFVDAVNNPISRVVGRELNCAVRTYQSNLILFKDIYDRGSPVQMDPEAYQHASNADSCCFYYALLIPNSYLPEGVFSHET